MEQSELVLIVTHISQPGQLGVGARFKLHGETVVGRSPEADVQLDDRTVSRHHARFMEHNGVWRIANLTEHNGVFVNGHAHTKGEPAALLEDGSHIQIGGVLLHVHVMLGTVPVTTSMASEHVPFLHLVRDGDGCTTFCKGRFVAMKPSSALALYALGLAAGEVVHVWDLEQAMGITCNLPQALSGVRRALRALLDEGWIRSQELCGLIRKASGGGHLKELETLEGAALVRRFVMARRGHGYILMAPSDAISITTAG